jgi:hypothetical protein
MEIHELSRLLQVARNMGWTGWSVVAKDDDEQVYPVDDAVLDIEREMLILRIEAHPGTR